MKTATAVVDMASQKDYNLKNIVLVQSTCKDCVQYCHILSHIHCYAT